MTTETQAHAIARRFPIEAHAGWLLACDAPDNITKGQRMLDRMGLEDSERVITYRDYCIALYATERRSLSSSLARADQRFVEVIS